MNIKLLPFLLLLSSFYIKAAESNPLPGFPKLQKVFSEKINVDSDTDVTLSVSSTSLSYDQIFLTDKEGKLISLKRTKESINHYNGLSRLDKLSMKDHLNSSMFYIITTYFLYQKETGEFSTKPPFDFAPDSKYQLDIKENSVIISKK